MRPVTVTVGPLASATTTKIATAQRNYGTNAALALIGAASDAAATTVCASQSPAAAAFTINGTKAIGGVAYLPNQYIYITCAGDSHAITVAVVGLDVNSGVQTETITLTNTESSASTKTYTRILSLTPSGAVTGAVTVGSYTKATLDLQRQILFTPSGAESANSVVITGTDGAGSPISETLALVDNPSTAVSALMYKTVISIIITDAAAGNISVGTNGVSTTGWVRFDDWAPAAASIQVTVSGTVNYTVQATLDDPDDPTNPVAAASVTWVNSSDVNVVGATSTEQSNFAFAPKYARVLLNSGSGTATATFIQSSNGPR